MAMFNWVGDSCSSHHVPLWLPWPDLSKYVIISFFSMNVIFLYGSLVRTHFSAMFFRWCVRFTLRVCSRHHNGLITVPAAVVTWREEITESSPQLVWCRIRLLFSCGFFKAREKKRLRNDILFLPLFDCRRKCYFLLQGRGRPCHPAHGRRRSLMAHAQKESFFIQRLALWLVAMLLSSFLICSWRACHLRQMSWFKMGTGRSFYPSWPCSLPIFVFTSFTKMRWLTQPHTYTHVKNENNCWKQTVKRVLRMT